MKHLFLLAAALVALTASVAQSPYNYQRRSLFEVLPTASDDIVFLGNSITDGCEWAELFANPRIKNRGISGDRATWLNERVDPIVKGQPRQLFLMIGINDLAAGIAPQQVADAVRQLVERFAKESPKTELYIQSILPVNGVDTKTSRRNHWDKGAEIIAANKLLQEICAEKGLVYIDVFSALVNDKGMLDVRYSNDGLHLMAEGYLKWKTVLDKYVK